jgi:two-component system, cell cycle sensor histidine kinase and response regulator CckA
MGGTTIGMGGHGERLLSTIVEVVPDIIWVKDADDLRLVLVNKAGEDFFGESRDRLLGKTDHELFPADLADAFVATDRAALSDGAPLDIPEQEVISPARGVRVIQTTKFPISDDGGTVRFLVGISRDITEREAARDRNDLERQLQEARRMEAVGHLATGIAHDFNNLLTVIMGAGALLLDETGQARCDRRDVEDIIAAAHRGADLTRQLLAFSRRQVVQPRVLDLNSVVANVERLLRRLMSENVQLLTVRGDEDSYVRADPGQLEQIIANLSINARDAMPNGGTLTLATENVLLDEQFVRARPGARMGPHVLLSVCDTGTGMNDAVKAHLFEPFFSTKEPGKGTGLGLSTVHSIVQRSDGYVEAESEEGRGTTFRIYLPRVLRFELAAPGEPTLRTSLRGTETVIVVEDDESVREIAVRVLQSYGYSVLSASGADAAMKIAAMHDGPIHLLVTDVVLPGRSGVSLAGELAVARPELNVLFISGHMENAVALRGGLSPGIAMLQKPFTPTVLAQKVREILGDPQRPTVTITR